MHNEERLKRIIEKFAARPDKGLPQVLEDASQLEGAYRLLRNEQVKPAALLAAQARLVVIAHDTTTFVFVGERKALGRGGVDKGRGFLGHFALAIDAATAMPLGVVHVEAVVRVDEVVAKREVSLGARSAQLTPETRKRYPARHSRKATLEMSAHRRAELLRPQSRGANYSSRIVINVVRVVEKCPPRGAEPVEWLLYTSLPVDTPEQILCRRRCLSAALAHRRIFKALKTGCIYKQRQLEALHGLPIVPALSIPVAWQLLRLRTRVRTDPAAPGSSIVSPPQLACLRHELGQRALPARPTARDVLLASARLGGYLRNNGDPGWLTLARGLHEAEPWGYVRHPLSPRCGEALGVEGDVPAAPRNRRANSGSLPNGRVGSFGSPTV